MAFPLGTVLSAAPGLIAAAADIVRVIRERKSQQPQQEDAVDDERYRQLEELIEQQAVLIEELTMNNRNLSLAVRNNRRLSLASFMVAVLVLLLVFVF